MTDYIVANCETAGFNGTYIQAGPSFWERYDGEKYFALYYESGLGCMALWRFEDNGMYLDHNFGGDLPPDDPSINWYSYDEGTPSALTVTAASSGQNLTLTCAAGSYSLTGTNVTLTHTPASQNLTLACNAGSYSLTGTNADLTVQRNYTLVCDSASGGAYPDIIVSGAGSDYANGVYTPFGTYNGKTLYRMVSPGSPSGYMYIYYRFIYENIIWSIATQEGASGFYDGFDGGDTPDSVTDWKTLNGEIPAPTVTAAPLLGYVLTGTDVTLTVQRNYTLVCGAGSYSLTGTDTTFEVKRNYTLECEAGSYTLTGTDTTLTAQFHYSLVCEAGSYTYTGTDITFGNTTAYTLTCASGSYSLTGSDVSFAIQRNYTFACETGSYSLTGTDVTLTYTQGAQNFTLACETGSYALTGTDASLTSHRIFALGMGSYVLVGTSVGLFILSPTPACRTATIEYENRTLEVKCH